MNEYLSQISLYKKRFLTQANALTNMQKMSVVLGAFALVALSTYINASGAVTEVNTVVGKKTDQVVVRKVGDVDADAISKEGLSSFFGEITSKDIASIHSSRDGVITSWDVSVGEYVSAGSVLGYVTVTGASPEQQLRLAEQQAAAAKAKLDAESATRIAINTQIAYGLLSDKLKSVADKQRQLYSTTSGGIIATTYETELGAITAKQILFAQKLQDFARSVLIETYTKISASQQDPLSINTSVNFNLRFGVGGGNSQLQTDYKNYLPIYIQLVTSRTATQEDVRAYLDKTVQLLSGSIFTEAFTQTDLDTLLAKIQQAQTDFRDLSNILSQATIDVASKERERSQIGIELLKQTNTFDTELSIKKLESQTAEERALNEARGAELLAQKLSAITGGIIPILASRDGIIASVERNVGAYITVSDEIGIISNAHPKKMVRFTIPPSWKEIHTGDTLSISWRPEFAIGRGVITGISPVIDEKGGYQAEAMVTQDTPYPVGASVRIIPENSKKGVFVDHKAITFKDVTPYVWIVSEGGTIRQEAVTPGRQLGEYVEILSGLERGFSYLVILDPLVSLKKGDAISDLLKTDVAATSTPKKALDENKPHTHDE